MDLYLKNTYSEGKPIKIEYCVAPYGVLQKKDAKVFYRNPDGTYTPEPASEDSKKVYKIPIYMPGQSGFPYSAVPIYDDYKCGIGYLSCRNLINHGGRLELYYLPILFLIPDILNILQ